MLCEGDKREEFRQYRSIPNQTILCKFFSVMKMDYVKMEQIHNYTTFLNEIINLEDKNPRWNIHGKIN